MKRKFFTPPWAGLAVLILACTPAGIPEEALERYARAAGLYSEGRFTETLGMLAAAEAFPPAQILRGKAAYFSGETGIAEEAFRRVLKKRPAAAEASLFLARILRDRGMAREAERIVEELLGDDPSDIRALRLAADIALEKGPSGEAAAVAFLDRAAEAASETALVFLDRARIRWIAGNRPGALEDLTRARNLLPRNSPLMRALENLESAIREAGQ